MSIVQAVLLGLIQGITEFLPISSSAHLILLPRFLDWPDQGLVADAAANSGTLVAVMVYFRQELLDFARSGWRFVKAHYGALAGLASVEGRALNSDGRLAMAVLLATIPVAVAGLVGYDFIAGSARNPTLIAWTSIVFGLALYAADIWGRKKRELGSLRIGEAFLVGIAQAMALLPGTSRSGATMTAGLMLGFDRENAARLSFLLAIPVGLLVAANDLLGIVTGEVQRTDLLPILIVFLVSAAVGYLSIDLLLAWLRNQGMGVFVIYRVLLGITLLILF